MTTTAHKIEAKDLNAWLDPLEILKVIGYAKSNPITSGVEVRDCCPIHRGDNPTSLAINKEKKCFHCHSCGAKGSLIDLYVQSMEQLSSKKDFPRILEELASLTNYHQVGTVFNAQTIQSIHRKVTAEDFSFLKEVWDRSKEEGSHPYLKEKKIESCLGIRFGKDEQGNDSIVVPYRDIDENLRGIQYVNLEGKYWHKGSKTAGCFFALGDIDEKGEVWVAEGMATACTVWESLGSNVLVLSASSKGNIPSLIKVLHERYPQIKIIAALDSDAKDVLDRIEMPIGYCMPSFEGLQWKGREDNNKGPTDFNDLASRCGKGLDAVKRQLNLIEKKDPEGFFEKLGHIIEDQKFSISVQERSYDAFELEHKRLFSTGGLITGFERLDEKVHFSKGDFVTFQGMSNHGKSTLMLSIAYRFLNNEENKNKDPMCLFVTYESTPIRVEEKLLNIISHEHQEGTILRYCRASDEKYLYPNRTAFKDTIDTYNALLKEKRMNILKRVPLEKLGQVIDLYKKEFPNRTIAIFLDYIQIIDTSIKSDGWGKIKNIAYTLESLAIEKEVILLAAAQVNEKRQAREGRDIFNASTINIDIFNHSHASIKSSEDLCKLYKDKVDGKDICTLEIRKQKHGPSFILEDYLLFNGHYFNERAKHLIKF